MRTGRVDEKATQLHAIASLKALLDAAKTDGTTTVESNNRTKPVEPDQNSSSVQPADGPLSNIEGGDEQNGDAPTLQVNILENPTFSKVKGQVYPSIPRKWWLWVKPNMRLKNLWIFLGPKEILGNKSVTLSCSQ